MADLPYTLVEASLEVEPAGLSIFYKDYRPANGSDKIPVLYLPGFMRTERDFHRVARYLAGDRRVITVDTRGRGKATRAVNAEAYHFDRLVEDVWKLLDHLRVDRVVIVGLALGAFMAWRMVAEHPNRIAGIVSNDTGVETSSKASHAMRANADHNVYTLDEAVEKLRGPNRQYFPDLDAEGWRNYALQVYTDTGGDRYVRDFDALVLEELDRFKADVPDFWAEFRGISLIPVTILHAENSAYLSTEMAERMATAIPTANVIHVPVRGHPLLLDEPQSLAAIQNLLDRVDLA